jgi:hypothetical protein
MTFSLVTYFNFVIEIVSVGERYSVALLSLLLVAPVSAFHTVYLIYVSVCCH